MATRILVVDDSVVIRKLLTTTLEEVAGMEVVATAALGRVALAKIPQCQPDIVILDVEMPEMDGIETLRQIRKLAPRLPVIMFSTRTERGAAATVEALTAGASDYVAKPSNVGNVGLAMQRVREELIPKIQALTGGKRSARSTTAPPPVASARATLAAGMSALAPASAPVVSRTATPTFAGMAPLAPTVVMPALAPATAAMPALAPATTAMPALAPATTAMPALAPATTAMPALAPATTAMPALAPATTATPALPATTRMPALIQPRRSGTTAAPDPIRLVRSVGPRPPVEIVAIGASTGGPNALAQLLAQLPAEFPVPIVIVQHMLATFTRHFAERLAAQCRIQVVEANAGDVLAPGRAYLARGDYHLTVDRKAGRALVAMNQGEVENFCRPAVDVLFRSVAQGYGPGALAVVLTGMGHDGLLGCGAIRDAGGDVIVQDEASSVVWGMPGFVARAGLASQVLAIDALGGEVRRRVALSPRAESRS
jgi:two-component system chemotaxis response regulator CheB